VVWACFTPLTICSSLASRYIITGKLLGRRHRSTLNREQSVFFRKPVDGDALLDSKGQFVRMKPGDLFEVPSSSFRDLLRKSRPHVRRENRSGDLRDLQEATDFDFCSIAFHIHVHRISRKFLCKTILPASSTLQMRIGQIRFTREYIATNLVNVIKALRKGFAVASCSLTYELREYRSAR